MEKLLTVLAIVLFPLFVCSQTATISDPISIRNDRAYELIGKMEGKFLLFRDKETSYEIQAFDKNMRLSWQKEIELDKKNPSVLGVTSRKDNFHLVYSFKHKGRTIVKAQRYDAAANLIDSVTVKDYTKRYFPVNAEVIISEDKKTILLYHFDKQTELEAVAFNLETMKVLWDEKFVFDDIGFLRDFKQLLVDNKGRMYLVLEKENRKSQREKHRFELYTYGSNWTSIDKSTLPMDGKLTYDISFVFDNMNDNLVAAGLYSENSRGRTNGYFTMTIPPLNPENHSIHFEAFKEDFILDLTGKKSDSNKGFPDADIQEVVLRKDGGLLLVGERNKKFERRTGGGRGFVGANNSRYLVDYYFDDIFVVSIHPEGELHWKTILRKRQYSQDDDAIFSSYFLVKTPRSLRFLFNDEIRYENTVSEYILKSSGEYDRNSVLSTDDQKIRLRFRDALQVSSNEIIIPSELRNKLKLVRLVY